MNTLNNEITIIIVLYEENIQLVLRYLEKIKNFKIIIVDNANNIPLKKKVEKNYRIYKYIVNKKNYGYAKAANQAIKLSDTKFILMFQADGIIDQKNISKLVDAHMKYENSFIVTPTLFDVDEKLSTNLGTFPEKNLNKVPIMIDGDICAETVLGSIVMFKKEDILEIGLYDENFYYAQDYKLYLDLLSNGYNIKAINKPLYNLNTINNISSNNKDEQKYYFNCARKRIVPVKKL